MAGFGNEPLFSISQDLAMLVIKYIDDFAVTESTLQISVMLLY